MRNTAVFLTISISILSVTVFTMSIYAQPPQEYVTGEVYNSSGGLVASVWVILRQGNNEKGRSLTGDDGRYYIGNLNSGEYEISVEGENKRRLFSRQINLPQNRNYPIRLDQ